MAFSVFCISASAVSGRTTIQCSSTNPTVGDTITVTVNFSTDSTVNAAEGLLSYSSDVLEFVSGNNTNLAEKGKVKLVNMGDGTVFSFSANFKVIGGGAANVIASDCIVSEGTGEYPLSSSSIRVVALTGNEGVTSSSSSSSETKKSSNADLKSITVAAGTLTPAFSANVTEYSVTVPYDKTDGILSCKVAHGNARLKFGGNRDLAVGITKRTITVTAEDGTQKVYTVTFNRLNENGEDTTAAEIPETAVEVTYNGAKYFINDNFEDITLPVGFGIDVLDYNGQEVPCIKGASGSVIAVSLISEETSEKKFFLYDKTKGFSELKYITVNDAVYVVMENTDIVVPNGYRKAVYEDEQLSIAGFAPLDTALKDYFVISAVAPNGETAFYRYDTAQKTLQRYPEFLMVEEAPVVNDELPSSRKILVIGLGILAIELLIAILVIAIVLIVKTVKKKADEESENEYEIDSESDFTLNDTVSDSWIKTPEEEKNE